MKEKIVKPIPFTNLNDDLKKLLNNIEDKVNKNLKIDKCKLYSPGLIKNDFK